MKQTTSNKSDNPESCQRAWRLLSIVAAYFACSDHVLPFLTEHLTSAANDRRRICHGTAAVCLSNLRKTQRCGGRKNVPSVEEVTAVSAGRSARRQIYRLPGNININFLNCNFFHFKLFFYGAKICFKSLSKSL